jgi:hypothetical protein
MKKMKSLQARVSGPTVELLQCFRNKVLIETWFKIPTSDILEKFSFPFTKKRL